MEKNKEVERENRKVVYNKGTTVVSKKRVVLICATAIFLIYCTILLVKLLRNPTDNFIVENGKIYQEESSIGYIIRDEQVVENEDASNNIVQLKAEGKKVANGEAIYRYSLENENEIKEKIEELDKQIQELLRNENNLFSTDIKLLESQVEDTLEKVYENTNLQEIEQYKKEISNEITKKAKIAGNLTTNGSYVKQLIQQRSEYENQLNTNAKYIYSNKSGIVSYRIDELESKLTVGDFNYLNKDFLESLKLKTGQIVGSNSTKVKIVNNFKCYIACISKTDEAKKSEVGNKLKIRLPNSEEIPAKIVHKADQGNGDILLVFEIEQSVEKLMDYRKIMFDIIWWSDSGIKIPNSAINYEGNFAYVIRNRAGYEEKILVKVLRQNDSYSIVENYSTEELEQAGYNLGSLDSKKTISLYDEIIIKKK